MDPDAISQRLHGERLPNEEWIDIPAPGVRALCKLAEAQRTDAIVNKIRIINMLGALPSAIPEVYTNATHLGLTSLPRLHWEDIRTSYLRDPSLNVVLTARRLGIPVNTMQNVHLDSKLTLKECDRLTLKGGLLYQDTRDPLNHHHHQLVLPGECRDLVMKSLHDERGHSGVEQTL